ncbi:MAG: chemotaxis protein CheB [Planctomycetota bacterium]
MVKRRSNRSPKSTKGPTSKSPASQKAAQGSKAPSEQVTDASGTPPDGGSDSPQDDALQGGNLQGDAPQDSAPQDSAPQEGASRPGLSQAGTPEQVASSDASQTPPMPAEFSAPGHLNGPGGSGGLDEENLSAEPRRVWRPQREGNDAHTPRVAPVVVGIGASAGGLQAIQTFFNHLPNDTGASFLVVQHLSPDFKSLMDEILRRHTSMPVLRVEDCEALRPNTVYLLPPRMNIVVKGDFVRTEAQQDNSSISKPIDVMFESLASECAESSIAIIFSGTGTDGSLGARAIRASGGVVLAQDPSTAEFDGMPSAAIKTSCVDFVDSPRAIAGRVATLAKHPFMSAQKRNEEALQESQGQYEGLLRSLREATGIDLGAYRPSTILRRIERRMSLCEKSELSDYAELVATDHEEASNLAKDCFIHVTRFFRDLQAFWALRQEIIRSLEKHPNRADPYRVWVAGCSTGEEAYSIAALVDHCIRETDANCDFKIFATDIDDDALEVASAGRYPDSAEVDVPHVYFDSMFRREHGTLRIRNDLRNRIVFAKHDVLSDPPFPRADLVSCRNMLIYLRPDAQATVLSRFHFALRRSSILFLGSAESVESVAGDFHVVDQKWKICTKKSDGRSLPVMTQSVRAPTARQQSPRPSPRVLLQEHPLVIACEHLIKMMATAAIIASETGEVVCAFGDLGSWLEMPQGVMSTELRDLLPGTQASAVMLAIRQARTSKAKLHISRLPNRNSGANDLALDLMHIDKTPTHPGFDVLLLRKAEREVPSIAHDDLMDADASFRKEIEKLEAELQNTRQSLQATIEELESTNEEMQSVNEELFASNEELQSTNEELHSVNEELYTVNSEHQQKIAELATVSDDLENLLKATQIGCLFLDGNLNIRRFTPAVEVALPLRDTDLGRSLLEISAHIDGVDLGARAKDALTSNERFSATTKTRKGVPLLIEIQPFMLSNDKVNGVVMTFVNMAHVDSTRDRENAAGAALEALQEADGRMFWIIDSETLAPTYLSPGYEKLWGRSVPVVPGRLEWLTHVDDDDRGRVEREFLARHKSNRYECEYRITLPNGSTRWIRDTLIARLDSDQGAILHGMAEDITERVQLDRLQNSSREVHRQVCEKSSTPMMLVSRKGAVRWSNQAARTFLGTATVARLPSIQQIVQDDLGEATYTRLCADAKKSMTAATSDVALSRGRGESTTCRLEVAYVPGHQASEDQFFCSWQDLSDQLEREQQLDSENRRVQVEADTDPLTGLLNRRGLMHMLEHASAMIKRSGDQSMVVLIDCDEFKKINDLYGHAVGDHALTHVAQLLKSRLRPTDLLARVGGDEFLAVLPKSRLAEGVHVGQKIARFLEDTPLQDANASIRMTVSIGVAALPKDFTDAEEVIKVASTALKSSKIHGRNRVCYIDEAAPSVPVTVKDPDLDNLLSGKLRIVRQTINNVETGETVGHELFSRGTGKLSLPAKFFEASRQRDCLERLDLICLERCVEDVIKQSGDLPVHLNLFPTSLLLDSGDAVARVLEKLPAGTDAVIELSEQQFVGSSSKLGKQIQRLRDQGLKIALDDVGFGQSALETLLSVEPDIVKIDRRLIQDIHRDPGARRILERLLRMFAAEKLTMIAEGVETPEQRDVLVEMGLPLAQGYLWSKPDGHCEGQ